MLNPSEIAAQVECLASSALSVEDFVMWFRRQSHNFHAYQDEQAIAAIFEVEGALSEYNLGELTDAGLAEKLAVATKSSAAC